MGKPTKPPLMEPVVEPPPPPPVEHPILDPGSGTDPLEPIPPADPPSE